MIEIKEITSSETWPLRALVLKPHLTAPHVPLEGDDAEGSFHLGAVADGKIICIASFVVQPWAYFPDAKMPYRLRGMATHPQFRRRGAGRLLHFRAESELLRKGCDLLWFNAREKAFAFYESLGFSFHGEMFDLPQSGPHKVMYKALGRR